jgi:hypothetical protein
MEYSVDNGHTPTRGGFHHSTRWPHAIWRDAELIYAVWDGNNVMPMEYAHGIQC